MSIVHLFFKKQCELSIIQDHWSILHKCFVIQIYDLIELNTCISLYKVLHNVVPMTLQNTL